MLYMNIHLISWILLMITAILAFVLKDNNDFHDDYPRAVHSDPGFRLHAGPLSGTTRSGAGQSEGHLGPGRHRIIGNRLCPQESS